MRMLGIVTVVVLFLAPVASTMGDGGTQEEPKKDDQAGATAAAPAAPESPMDRCKATVARAREMIEKGKNTRGQGLMWQDKEMIAGGTKLYDEGEALLEAARKGSAECAKYIEDLENAQAGPVSKGTTGGEKKPTGEGRY